VTLSQKNTMTYLGSASSYHSANKVWLHEVSLDPLIKDRQVMSIMNAIVGNNSSGPGAAPNFEAHTVIMSKDIVAVDYCTLRLMEEQSNPNTRSISAGDGYLQAAEQAGLGTCTPSNMEIIEISPPWTTEIFGKIQEYNPLIKTLDVTTINRGETIEFILPSGMSERMEMTILDMKGSLVWKGRQEGHAVVWHKQSTNGTKVPRGMYTYQVTFHGSRSSGIVMISR
jgi:hypothetical protein